MAAGFIEVLGDGLAKALEHHAQACGAAAMPGGLAPLRDLRTGGEARQRRTLPRVLRFNTVRPGPPSKGEQERARIPLEAKAHGEILRCPGDHPVQPLGQGRQGGIGRLLGLWRGILPAEGDGQEGQVAFRGLEAKGGPAGPGL